MTIYIAREGEEIGECERADLAALAREGQVLPTDYYWHEGMEDWRLVNELLTELSKPEAARAPRVLKPRNEDTPTKPLERTVRITTEPAPPVQPVKQYRDPKELLRQRRKVPREAPKLEVPKSKLRLVFLIIAALLLIALGLYAFFAWRAERIAHGAALFPSNATPAESVAAPANIDEVRDSAFAELKQRVARLPTRAEPPLNRFFFNGRIEMKKALSPRIPCWAIIRGGENVVDPETQKTLVTTDFILTTEYRDGEWTFKYYRASASDLVKNETAEIEHDEKTPMPPSIVGMLGLKMPR